MENCFENFEIEDITICPQEEINSGLVTKLDYIVDEHIKTEATASEEIDYEGSVTLTGDIEPVTGKGFKTLGIQVDLGSLAAATIGNKGNKKIQTTIEVYLPGVKAKTIGFMNAVKNLGFVILVKDKNGTQWQIGTKDIPARFETQEANTGKVIEDNNGTNLVIVADTYPRVYTGVVPYAPVGTV